MDALGAHAADGADAPDGRERKNKGGRPATGNTVKPVSLTLPIELVAAMQAAAAAQGVPVSRLVAAAVTAFLEAGGVVPPPAPNPAAQHAARDARVVRLLREALDEMEAGARGDDDVKWVEEMPDETPAFRQLRSQQAIQRAMDRGLSRDRAEALYGIKGAELCDD